MMLEMAIGQSSEQDEGEQGKEPLNSSTQVPPPHIISFLDDFYRDRI